MLQAAPIPVHEQFPDVDKDVSEDVVEQLQIPVVASPPSLLQDLASVDRLFITKRLRVKNVLFLRGKKNRFYVRTPDQKLLYSIEEINSWWVGYLFYGLRPLQLRVNNAQGVEVMRIVRPYACTARVLPCQLQRLQVFSPPGQLVGTVEQQWTAVKPLYVIRNKERDVVFWIRGPLITISCFKDIKFDIFRADGSPVGGTCKRWQGVTHALFFAPVTDRFGVAFERNLTLEEKALLLAATLLMDYMYYDA
ncbi:phospholipid scramblase 2-like [Bombyx mandarina]|uniref:Phospholipid scramblase n=1 Tax=Bombyx mandarina TaxID=7092 RepID=A0A6J2KS02_BOMMA|nr:phospholipid scramblase 2-like [Bombyx mandarina]